MKRRLIIFFIISAFCIYIVGLYKHIKIKQQEWDQVQMPAVTATDFLIDFRMGWIEDRTYEGHTLIAVCRLSYTVNYPIQMWTTWSNSLDGLRFTDWGKYILWRTK